MKTIFATLVFMSSMSSFADNGCRIAIKDVDNNYIMMNSEKKELGKILEQKGYEFVRSAIRADFVVSIQLPYGKSARVKLTHKASGFQKNFESRDQIPGRPDPLRLVMSQDFQNANTVTKYKAAKAKWKGFEFKDEPGKNLQTIAITKLPDCDSLYKL